MMPMTTDTKRRSPTRLPRYAAAWSALATALGLWWLLDSGAYPYGPNDDRDAGSLLEPVPAQAGALALVLLGAGGVALGAALGRAGRAAVAVALGYAVLFGLLVHDAGLLIVAGYLCALSVPLGVLGGIAFALRSARSRVAAGLTVGLLLGAAYAAGVDLAALGRLGEGLASGFHGLGSRPFCALFLAVGGALWAAAGVDAYRRGRPVPHWASRQAAARWGRWGTVGAAVCALPYGLVRMTWLTPWPVGISDAGLREEPAIRLFGLLLGCAAIGGAVLTMGLISRWGRVWPRWMPRLRGRTVPVLLPTLTGACVAYLMTMAAPSMVAMSVESGEAWVLAFLPFPVWGPLLGAAALAYYLRYRETPVS